VLKWPKKKRRGQGNKTEALKEQRCDPSDRRGEQVIDAEGRQTALVS